MRLKKEKILNLVLNSYVIKFASEMVVKATITYYRIAKVPVILHQDGKSKPPHLNNWSDDWHHLAILLMYSPKWLFLFPSFFFLLPQ